MCVRPTAIALIPLILGMFVIPKGFSESPPSQIQFSIEADTANSSLIKFAVQSGRDLVFEKSEVQEVQTSAVAGVMKPSEALKRMLINSTLDYVMDAETGAFAIVQKEPERQSLSPEPSSTNSEGSDKHNPNQLLSTNMKKEKSLLGKIFKGLLGVALASSSTSLHAQELEIDEDVYELSPFEIVTEEDGGYLAKETLAGARVRTSLKDVASAISVVTEEFMQNTGATDNQTLLQYTPNTEVGGLYGNYAGVGNTFVSGIGESSDSLINPNSNTRVRGLDSADNTRNYFQTDIPWDGYIIDRVDLQRGPNSILFGIGSPAGIIDASPNTAIFEDQFELVNRVGKHDSLRTSVDINRVLIEDELMIRIALLDNNQKYRQKPAYSHDQRVFGALRWEPDLFKNESMHTSFKVNYERGNVTSNNPRVLPPTDLMEGFFAADGLNGSVIDGQYAQKARITQYTSGDGPIEGETANYWLAQYEGGVVSDGPLFIYDNLTSPSSAVDAYQNMMATYFALSDEGIRDSVIDGWIGAYAGMGGFSTYARNKHTILGNVAGVEAADKGFYKNRSISDPTVFDFFNNLLDGPNKIEKQDWSAFNASLSQSFMDNRLAFEAVFDRQEYTTFFESNGGTFISININANAMGDNWQSTGVTRYNGSDGTAGTNPYAGRAYTGGLGNGSASDSVRESMRFTATGELEADDFLKEDTWLTRLLGRHILTGLYSQNTHDRFSKTWMLYGTDLSYGEELGFGGGGNADYGNNTNVKLRSTRLASWRTYLSDPLIGRTSAHGINIQPITTKISPESSASIRYFDSHWKWSMDPAASNYVDPSADYELLNVASPTAPTDSSQAENPDNYVGWRSVGTNLLKATEGDRDALTTDASKIQKKTESKAFTWQGYLWDDTIVTTLGWRKDRQEHRSGKGTPSAVNGAFNTSFGLEELDADAVTEGETVSWGIVAHTPHQFRNKLPMGTNISLFYDEGNNARVENRYDFNGQSLPNSKGETKDYGIVINTLNDRLQLKVTWYETTVRDANISSVTTATSTLGSYQSELSSLEAWGTASSLMILAGFDGLSPWQGWYWNYANTDDPDTVTSSSDNSSPEFLNHPSTIAERAAVESWLSQLYPQEWYDAYEIPIDVNLAAAGDYMNAVQGWDGASGYITGVNPSPNNTVNGVAPTGTVDNKSEGVEIEVVGQITDSWNVAINASKQTSSQIALGTSLVDFIETQYAKYQTPAGDLRLWWAGDKILRDYYNSGVWAAYQFQKQTNGKLVPEMSPWRANVVTNYMIKDGNLKGLNFGGSYRWQQGVILGYGLNEAKDNLDVDRPYWGDDQDAIDLWVGYQRQLTDNIHWRVQLNVRNVGEDPHLIPISVQPNGNPANYRIQEGQSWFLTNTFSF